MRYFATMHSSMQKYIYGFVTFLVLITTSIAPVGANAPIMTPPPDIAAKNYILIDALSGTTIAGHKTGERIEPASITKLMTVYIVYQALRQGQINFADSVTVSKKAWKMKGSRMFIEPNKEVTVEELIYGTAIQSGNDASIALAEHVAGSEGAFVQIMNKEAERLDLKNTRFANATGWPHPDHYMSAADIATLAHAIIQDFPAQYKLYSQKQYTYNDITQYNRNRLLWREPSVDGVKTGYTEAAGFCLVSSAARNNTRLIAVILGTKSDKQRIEQSATLLNFGFRFYTTKLLFHKHERIDQIRVWG